MPDESGGMLQSLIGVLRSTLTLELRSAPDSTEYLEGVLGRPELTRCYGLLTNALGAPAKDFNQAASFDGPRQRAVDGIGGIRLDQCLFLRPSGARRAVYGALWPWASDPTRITLKVGILSLG